MYSLNFLACSVFDVTCQHEAEICQLDNNLEMLNAFELLKNRLKTHLEELVILKNTMLSLNVKAVVPTALRREVV